MRGSGGAWRLHHWLPARTDSFANWARERLLMRSALPLRLNMASEVVENGLPASALLLDGMSCLTIEGYAHRDTIRPRSKLDLRGAVAERILDQLVVDDLRIGSSEVEAHAAVLCLHPRGKDSAFPQIHRSSGGVPIVGGCVPLLDVFGCGVGAPDPLDRGGDVGFDGDFHGVLWCGAIALRLGALGLWDQVPCSKDDRTNPIPTLVNEILR